MTNVLPFEQRVRGRAAPARQRHTFKDSGITVELHKIGPTTIQRIAETIRREARALPVGDENRYPEPPVEVVEIGGVKSEERNVNSPEYRAALDRWGQWAMGQVNDRLFRVAAVDAVIPVDTTDEEIHEVVSRVRRRLAAEGVVLKTFDGYTPEENDRIVWVQHVCVSSTEDMTEFYAALTKRSQISEEAVDAHLATFRAPTQPDGGRADVEG